MTALKKRGAEDARMELWDTFERMLDDWVKVLPFRRPFLAEDWSGEQAIRVDELHENGTLVIRAAA